MAALLSSTAALKIVASSNITRGLAPKTGSQPRGPGQSPTSSSGGSAISGSGGSSSSGNGSTKTYENILYTAPSQIAAAGMGLFVKRAVPKGGLLCPYRGKRFSYAFSCSYRTIVCLRNIQNLQKCARSVFSFYNSHETFRRLYPNQTWLKAPYAITPQHGCFVVDAYDKKAQGEEFSLARYANDCTMIATIRLNDAASKPCKWFTPSLWCPAHVQDAKLLSLNAEFMSGPTEVYLVAQRDLAAGEEVFVAYGTKYWGTTKDVITNDILQWMIKTVHGLPWFTVDHLLKAFGLPLRSHVHRKELLYLLKKMHPFVLPMQQYGFALNQNLHCIRFLSRVYKNN